MSNDIMLEFFVLKIISGTSIKNGFFATDFNTFIANMYTLQDMM